MRRIKLISIVIMLGFVIHLICNASKVDMGSSADNASSAENVGGTVNAGFADIVSYVYMEKKESSEQQEEKAERETTLLKRDDHFVIEYTEGVGYYYAIYNADHELVREGERPGRYEPQITYVDENIIQILFPAGTGTYFCTYYDIQNDRFSEEYESPVEAGFGMIAVYDITSDPFRLIVRDIFDDTLIYNDSVLVNMYSTFWPVTYAEFLDERTLLITYLTRDQVEIERTVILDLEVESDETDAERNPYFYEKNLLALEADAEYYRDGDERSAHETVRMEVYKVHSYEEGELYRLKVCGVEAEYLHETRLNKYFYVTADKIYLVGPAVAVGNGETVFGSLTLYGDDELLVNVLDTDEKVMLNSYVICQTEDVSSGTPGEYGVSYHVHSAEDKVYYSWFEYNPGGELQYYESMTWELGRGLTEFTSGYRAEAEILYLTDIHVALE